MAAHDPHQQALMAAAAALGIETRPVESPDGYDVVAYTLGGHVELVREGKFFSHLTAAADRLGREKHACKLALEEVGIPTPPGIEFTDAPASEHAISAWCARGIPQIMKPTASEGGEGIRPGLRSYSEVHAHWLTLRAKHPRCLIEDLVPGRDLRIQAIAGKLVAACIREPAAVVGDGLHTLEELIAARRVAMRAQNPCNQLDVDDETRGLLIEQELALEDVPACGRRIVLKRIANLALGGHAVDVTDAIHPRYHDWVAATGARLGLRVYAVDVMATDIAADPATHAHVIEVNTRPDWLHHTFSEGRTHDIPSLLLRDLFALDARA